ncbi:hypothetical protein UlMin_043104 [Ulmus minor]
MWSQYEVCVKAILPLLLASLTFLWLRRTAKNSKELPPGPRGLPLVGYLPFLGTDLHKELTKLATIYGPIYKFWLANKLCIVINSPSLVKEVVRDHDTIFSNREPTVAAMVASFGAEDIAFRAYSPEWNKLRKIFVREMLSKSMLDNLYPLRKEQVKKSIRHVYENIGKPVDVGNLAFLTAIKSIVSMTCGASFEEGKMSIDEGEIKKTAGELMVLLGKPNVSDIFPALAWFDLQGVEKDAKRVTRVFEGLLKSAIQQRESEMVAGENGGRIRKDFMQFLLELHQNQDGESSLTKTQLKGLLMDIVVGGTDTTATTVEWAMAELLNKPETLNKVQQELTKVVGSNKQVEESHLSQLTYLEAVIKETFRLHPALPLLVPRRPIQSTTVGGYKVPEGSRIFLNIGAIQRDPSVWENPLEFRPERFLESGNVGKFDLAGNNFGFLPFGSGRRGCPGISLADRMLKYMMASFLHLFEWKLEDSADLELLDRFGIVVKTKEPVVAIPTPRFSNLDLYA